MRSLPLDEIQAMLLRGIMERHTVQQLFDDLYALIHLPMICFDPSFSLMAYSFERPFYYPHWEWLAQRGSAAEEVILEYDYFTNQEQMIRKREPLLFNEGNTYGFAQFCGAVMNGDQLMAYCGIMVEDAVQDQVREATRLLIKAVSVVLHKETQIDGLDYALIVDRSLSRQQEDYLSEQYPGGYLFAVLTCRVYQSSTLQYVKSHLLWKGHKLISCLIGQDMLYLLACCQPTGGDPSLLFELNTLAETYHLMIGISDYFETSEGVPMHREQALLTLSLGVGKHNEREVFRFEELYCELICQTAVEYYGPELCQANEIRKLVAEDRIRGTEYLRTLETWLDNGRQNSVAAEKLGQHKATIANRLDRIGYLLGESPKDSFQRLQLELDLYRMLQTENEREGKEAGQK